MVPRTTTRQTLLREQPADVTAAVAWSKANNFRIDMLYNGGGSTGNPTTDPLLAAFQANKSAFGWINHTWDHPNLDQGCASASLIQSEITQNTAFATGTLGLTASTDPSQSYGVENPGELVTGEHSGLADLVPGNPGTVDPPEFNSATMLWHDRPACRDLYLRGHGPVLADRRSVHGIDDPGRRASPSPACHGRLGHFELGLGVPRFGLQHLPPDTRI